MSADGKVTALLTKDDRRPARVDWRIDMKGRVVLPGMIDAHGHVMELGFRAMELDTVGNDVARRRAEPDQGLCRRQSGAEMESWAGGGTRKSGSWDASPPPRSSMGR